MEAYEDSTKLSISVCFLSRNACVSAVFAVGQCLSVRRLVHCIHTAEDIVKLISRPHHSSFWPQRRGRKMQGRWENFAI